MTTQALRRAAMFGAIVLLATTVQPHVRQRASATFGMTSGPFLSGSRIPLHIGGLRPPYDLTVIGPGSVRDGVYLAPDVTSAQTVRLIVGSAAGMGVATFTIVPAPAASRKLIAVATYDDGIVLHDPATFERIATLGTGGAPGDVAFGTSGFIAATDTAGAEATLIARAPWNVTSVADVPLGNEVAIDNDGNVFISNRDVAGAGALTRIAPDGSVMRIVTGVTAEGLAIDRARGIVYVGNVNDATVLAVDAHTMKSLQRIPAVPRVFGIALSADANILYAVSNRSRQSPFAQPGYVVAIALGDRPHVVARSANLRFPLGVALDARDARLFVTDESADAVYVLDPATLHALHAPLKTCSTPWKPHYDAISGRLFVPCARANQVDVFDAHTLKRIDSAPFATGGYPLGVATWP